MNTGDPFPTEEEQHRFYLNLDILQGNFSVQFHNLHKKDFGHLVLAFTSFATAPSIYREVQFHQITSIVFGTDEGGRSLVFLHRVNSG